MPPKKKAASSNKRIKTVDNKIAELEAKVSDYMAQNSALLLSIQKKDEEIKHLKELLDSVTPMIGKPEPLSDEESIAYNQLNRLKAISEKRQLTLEETRIFDLLVKNKKISTDEPKTFDATNNKKLNKKDLIAIAKTITDNDRLIKAPDHDE